MKNINGIHTCITSLISQDHISEGSSNNSSQSFMLMFPEENSNYPNTHTNLFYFYQGNNWKQKILNTRARFFYIVVELE